MKYIVMESKLGYAIVMDSKGRFQKVVNLDYEVGQELDDVLSFEMEDSRRHKKSLHVWTLAAAACLCIFFYAAYANLLSTYGVVRMQINPDILIEVNKLNYVIDVDGLNEDGEELVDDYSYSFKKIDTVSAELAERALQFGYLATDGEITIEVTSDHDVWKTTTQSQIISELTAYFNGALSVHEPYSENNLSADTNMDTLNDTDDLNDDVDDDDDDDHDDDDDDHDDHDDHDDDDHDNDYDD